MGRKIDFEKPLSEADKEYLRSRGSAQASKIIANERRFGVDGKRQPSEFETAGPPAESASFDPAVRANALVDVGGVPLPGTILDKDTGRVIPLSARSELDIMDLGDEATEDFDDDIIAYVEELKVAELKAELKKFPAVEVSSEDKKEDLQDKLIIALQDERNESKSTEQARAEEQAFNDLAGDFAQPVVPPAEPGSENPAEPETENPAEPETEKSE